MLNEYGQTMKKIILFSFFGFFLIIGLIFLYSGIKDVANKNIFKYELAFDDGNLFKSSSDKYISNKFLGYPVEKRNGLLKIFLFDEDTRIIFLFPFVRGNVEGEHTIMVEPWGSEALKSKSFGRVVINYKKGLREGLTVAYVNDEDLYVRGSYHNDHANGRWVYNYSNGKPGAILDYEDGYIFGKLLFYKKDGTLLAEGEADEAGALTGVFIHPMALFYRHLNRPYGCKVSVIKVRDGEIIYQKEFPMTDLIEGKVEPEWENF